MRSEHSKSGIFFLCLFLGFLGVHRFAVGKTGTGLLWMFTFGLGMIGWIIDLFTIMFGSFTDKDGNRIR